jgi:hypothetical protein
VEVALVGVRLDQVLPEVLEVLDLFLLLKFHRRVYEKNYVGFA